MDLRLVPAGAELIIDQWPDECTQQRIPIWIQPYRLRVRDLLKYGKAGSEQKGGGEKGAQEKASDDAFRR